MATFVGNDGDVLIGGAAMAQVLFWRITTSVGIAPSAVKGAEWDEHTVGRKDWVAVVRAQFDGSAPQVACEVGNSVELKLRTSSAAGAPTFEGTGLVTAGGNESTEDPAELMPFEFTVSANSDLVRGTA